MCKKTPMYHVPSINLSRKTTEKGRPFETVCTFTLYRTNFTF